MARAELKAWTMRTAWHPIPDIGKWPLDHVAVSSSSGTEWGCWGRKRSEENPQNVTEISTGEGEELWASAIGEVELDEDGDPRVPKISGLKFGFTGICHHAAMRLLIPAAGDVQDSPGNEIATPLFGKFGLDVEDLVGRLERAAEAANKASRWAVPSWELRKAIKRVTGGLEDEWEIIDRDIDEFVRPKWPNLDAAVYKNIKDLYYSLYIRREALYQSYELKKINRVRYLEKMRLHFVQTLEDVNDLVGPLSFGRMFGKLSPELAAEYVFFVSPIPQTDSRGKPVEGPKRESAPPTR